MYWVSFPLEHTSNAERGILTHGQPRFSISSAQACTLERINYKLEVVHEFVYLGSTITDNLSIDSELNKRIGKAALTLSSLTKCVWSNNKLSDHTKFNVYKAFVSSTLLYGSESMRTMRAHQEKRLNVFHMRCLRRILGITWHDRVANKVVLEKAGIPSSLKAKAHAMARTCDTDERWPHSKRPFIWRTGDREKTNRTTPTMLQ